MIRLAKLYFKTYAFLVCSEAKYKSTIGSMFLPAALTAVYLGVHLKAYLFFLSASLFLVSAFSFAGESQSITVTTFNIRFYGLGGSMKGTPQDETRDADLKKFIANYIPETDLFVFQEIVDVNRLVQKVLPKNFECISYDNNNPRHQFVVLCHKTTNLKFKEDPNDPDSIIEEVSNQAGSNRSRPAVHTLVTDLKGNILLRFIGVHLKAFPTESATRIKQVKAIADFLKASKIKAPVVIGGDFNTYDQDHLQFNQVFKSRGLALKEAANPSDYTYRNEDYQSKFDRFWISSKELKQADKAVVHSACNAEVLKSESNFRDPAFYLEAISDHCPVTVKLSL